MTQEQQRLYLRMYGWTQAPLEETGGDEFWIPPRDETYTFAGEDWLTVAEAAEQVPFYAEIAGKGGLDP